MKTYPESINFRLPEISSFQMAYDPGVLRDTQWPVIQQRRHFSTWSPRFDAKFIIPRDSANAWQQWWNENAYGWFKFRVPIMWTNQDCSIQIVRCIDDLQAKLISLGKFVEYSTRLELAPGTYVTSDAGELNDAIW